MQPLKSNGQASSEEIPSSELLAFQDIIFNVIAYMSETRENVTGNHIYRIQGYVKALAEHLRPHPRFSYLLDNVDTITRLYKSATLHDIGSVGIPDRIYLKPGRLTADEFEVIKSHTVKGLDFVLAAERDIGKTLSVLTFTKEIIYSHHERWDGSGYPEGLAGNDIPLSARITAVADVYDALRSRRVYKQPVSHEEAVEILLENKGIQFDPDIVDAFHQIHEVFRDIAWKYADSESDFKKKIEYLEQAIAVSP